MALIRTYDDLRPGTCKLKACIRSYESLVRAGASTYLLCGFVSASSFQSKCLSRIRVEMMRASYFARESHRQRRGSLREGPAGVDSAMFWVIEIKLPSGLNTMT